MKWNESLTISVNVRNNGPYDGDHTVLLYISDQYRSVTPPNKELKGYLKQKFLNNEQKSVQFTLTKNDLSFIGIDLTRQAEAGDFTVTIDNLNATFTLLPDPSPTTATTTAATINTTATAIDHSCSLFSVMALLVCSLLL